MVWIGGFSLALYKNPGFKSKSLPPIQTRASGAPPSAASGAQLQGWHRGRKGRLPLDPTPDWAESVDFYLLWMNSPITGLPFACIFLLVRFKGIYHYWTCLFLECLPGA